MGDKSGLVPQAPSQSMASSAVAVITTLEGKDEKRPASPASPQKAGQGGTGRSGPGCSAKGKNGFIRAGASPGSLGKMDSGSLRGWILNPPYTVTLTEEASRGSAALPVGGAAHLQLVWQDLKN